VHSLVQFEDGSMKAQMGLPDMKLPIQYAMAYPQRIQNDFPRFNFMDYPNVTLEQPDRDLCLYLNLAVDALNKKGNMACILNAANEVSVQAFLNDKIGFLDIARINQACMEKVSFVQKPSYEDYVQTDVETRIMARELEAAF
jgi:1-deoxy-D-xylulose-5-phosphate reductoisomerase